MKLFIRTLLIVLFFSVSNQSYSQCSNCSVLFEQIKHDKRYISFLAINDSIVKLYRENAKNAARSEEMRERDSIFMRDSSISIKEKYAAMNYKGLKEITDLNRQAIETLAKLEEMYPLLKELTDDQFKIFIRMSTEYYQSLKKQ